MSVQALTAPRRGSVCGICPRDTKRGRRSAPGFKACSAFSAESVMQASGSRKGDIHGCGGHAARSNRGHMHRSSCCGTRKLRPLHRNRSNRKAGVRAHCGRHAGYYRFACPQLVVIDGRNAYTRAKTKHKSVSVKTGYFSIRFARASRHNRRSGCNKTTLALTHRTVVKQVVMHRRRHVGNDRLRVANDRLRVVSRHGYATSEQNDSAKRAAAACQRKAQMSPFLQFRDVPSWAGEGSLQAPGSAAQGA